MLPHYSPFKVAETFSLLAGLYPGADRPRPRPRRGHGPADDVRPPARSPPGRAGRLPRAARRAARPPRGHAARGPRLRPARRLPARARPSRPVPWLLGSSHQSAVWAGELGLPYAFADFINPRGAEIAELYRDSFTPSRRLEDPRTVVAVWALAAETEAEAAAARVQRPHGDEAPAPRAARRRAAGRGGVAFLARDARSRPPRESAAAGWSSATPAGPGRDRGGRRRLRGGGGRSS